MKLRGSRREERRGEERGEGAVKLRGEEREQERGEERGERRGGFRVVANMSRRATEGFGTQPNPTLLRRERRPTFLRRERRPTFLRRERRAYVSKEREKGRNPISYKTASHTDFQNIFYYMLGKYEKKNVFSVWKKWDYILTKWISAFSVKSTFLTT